MGSGSILWTPSRLRLSWWSWLWLIQREYDKTQNSTCCLKLAVWLLTTGMNDNHHKHHSHYDDQHQHHLWSCALHLLMKREGGEECVVHICSQYQPTGGDDFQLLWWWSCWLWWWWWWRKWQCSPDEAKQVEEETAGGGAGHHPTPPPW